MSNRRAKDSVFLIRVPEDFHPQRAWDLPHRADSIELYVKNVGLVDAVGFCRVHNTRQLRLGFPENRLWALPVRKMKCRYDLADVLAPVSQGAAAIAASPAPADPKPTAGSGRGAP